MESAIDGSKVLVRLDDGEDLFESLITALRSHSVTYGCILFGIGQLKDFELGYFDGNKYHRKMFQRPYELVSLQGSVSLDSDPPLHMHASLSKEDMTLVGGHLFKATVSTINEICVQRFLSIQMRRKLNGATGLKKLTLK